MSSKTKLFSDEAVSTKSSSSLDGNSMKKNETLYQCEKTTDFFEGFGPDEEKSFPIDASGDSTNFPEVPMKLSPILVFEQLCHELLPKELPPIVTATRKRNDPNTSPATGIIRFARFSTGKYLNGKIPTGDEIKGMFHMLIPEEYFTLNDLTDILELVKNDYMSLCSTRIYFQYYNPMRGLPEQEMLARLLAAHNFSTPVSSLDDIIRRLVMISVSYFF